MSATPGELKTRRLDELKPNRLNPRGPLADDDVADLVETIRGIGILQPLVCLPDGTVVVGHRRRLAAILAGETDAPVYEREMSEHEQLLAMTAENVSRKDLSPAAEARAYRDLIGFGMSVRDVARYVGVPPQRVSDRLALFDLPAPVIERVDRGEIPLGAVRALAKLDGPEQARVAEAVATRQLRVADIAPARKLAHQRGGLARRASVVAAAKAARADEPEPQAPASAGDRRCAKCWEHRQLSIATLSALRRAEQLISDQLGARYVPARPPILQGR